MNVDYNPSVLEMALIDRWNMVGFGQIGPLTRRQQQDEDSYLAWCAEQEAEYELEQQHGGRERCPRCDRFEVEQLVVNQRQDPTVWRKCRTCGWEGF